MEWIEIATAFAAGIAVCLAVSFARRRIPREQDAPFEALGKQLELAQQLTLMAFFEWNLRSGQVTWLGDEVPIFGTKIRTFEDFKARVHPNDLDRMVSLTVNALERNAHPGAEYRIIRPDGQIRWVTGRTQVIRDASGTPVKMFGMNMDIDERKRAMMELEKAQSEHRVIFDSSRALIWYKDRNNRILRLNKPAAAALNKRPEEIEGKSTYDVYPEEAAKYYADDLEVMDRGEAKLGIVEVLTSANGEKSWVRTDKIPYRDADGNIIGVIVFSQDITDQMKAEIALRQALEDARKANQAKSEFLANVSHEIRTPLGVIMGFSEMLKASELPAATRLAYADKVLRNGKRLLKLIDEILDLSKIEQGRIDIEVGVCSLRSVLADAASHLGSLAREKGLHFRVVTSSQIPATIHSDASRLRQILLNVVGNAIKFTSQGGVVVDVSSVVEGEEESLALKVTDTGPGMTEKAAAGLFQPFHQADPEATRKFGGAGLGLALSRRLARALGGDITLVETTPGKGSTFLIKIHCGPKARATEQTSYSYGTEPKPEVVPPSGRLSGITLLLVEDNPDIQEMVRTFLRHDDVRLTIAQDGRAGVDTALRLSPDVVVMDIQLPLLDGLEATRELREKGFTKPILAMTAHAMRGQEQVCLEAGFSAFVTKPLSRSDFIGLLAELTGQA
jgi:PAS domain S-box-containing protein